MIQNFSISFQTIYLILHIEISIYDILGHHIVDLVNTDQNKGNKSISWNGKDRYGRYAPAGIYLYQLNVAGKLLAKKMIYLR